MDERWAARAYDGEQPTPLAGHVTLRQGVLEFAPESGASWPIDVTRIVHADLLGDELHVELGAADPGSFSPKLVVEDKRFAVQLEDLRRLRGGRRGAAASLLRRVPAWGWILLLLVVGPASFFAFTNGAEAAHVFVSVANETSLGELAYEQITRHWPAVENPELEGMLQEMVGELVDDQSPYAVRVSVLASSQANAFALPGGRVVIMSGLLELCSDPSAVAGVLAHEVAHVERRHGLRHMLRSLGLLGFASLAVGGGFQGADLFETAAEATSGLMILKHSRAAEAEADALAIAKLRAAGHGVGGLIDFWKRMQAQHDIGGVERSLAWLSTHPVTADRLATLERAGEDTAGDERPWLADGAAWAESIEQVLTSAARMQP